nr:hypothetical protein [Tanacetum cinerariifolium]
VVGKYWGVMKMARNVGVRVYREGGKYCAHHSVLNVGYDRDGQLCWVMIVGCGEVLGSNENGEKRGS